MGNELPNFKIFDEEIDLKKERDILRDFDCKKDIRVHHQQNNKYTKKTGLILRDEITRTMILQIVNI